MVAPLFPRLYTIPDENVSVLLSFIPKPDVPPSRVSPSLPAPLPPFLPIIVSVFVPPASAITVLKVLLNPLIATEVIPPVCADLPPIPHPPTVMLYVPFNIALLIKINCPAPPPPPCPTLAL